MKQRLIPQAYLYVAIYDALLCITAIVYEATNNNVTMAPFTAHASVNALVWVIVIIFRKTPSGRYYSFLAKCVVSSAISPLTGIVIGLILLILGY